MYIYRNDTFKKIWYNEILYSRELVTSTEMQTFGQNFSMLMLFL